MENCRECFEELDRIEEALVQRIRKSDQFLPTLVSPTKSHPGSHRLSSRENALRRWEASKLVDYYNDLHNRASHMNFDKSVGNFESELQLINNLDDDLPATGIASKYTLYSQEIGRKRFVSNFTDSVIKEIDTKYPVKEQFGNTVDLEPWYNKLAADQSITEKPSNYREYLVHFLEYAHYGGADLVQYLLEFYNRANSIGTCSGTTAQEILACETKNSSTSLADAGRLFCKYCDREFSNENVFKSHLNGKKHQRALKNTTTTQDPHHGSALKNHETISLPKLIDLVRYALQATILDIDRKSRMSLPERKLEVELFEREREVEDNWESDTSENNEIEDDYAVSQPNGEQQQSSLYGTDRTPIPRWLFKLHGLGTIFRCEICGLNHKYAGRKAFERHFSEKTHITGLSRIGISYSRVFNGISSIKEAIDLHGQLRKQTHEQPKIDKEVEDDEGNVMTERMYADLKKQGLL